VVLTPLVSLMFDQKEKISQKEITVEEITVEFVGKVQDNEQTFFSALRGKFN